MYTLSDAGLTQLIFGVLVVFASFWVIGGKSSVLVKLIAAVFALAGIVITFNALPTSALHLALPLVLSLAAIAIGGALVSRHRTVGLAIIAIGVLAFVGAGYWDAYFPGTHTSLSGLWHDGWNAVQSIWHNANHGLDKTRH